MFIGLVESPVIVVAVYVATSLVNKDEYINTEQPELSWYGIDITFK